MPTLPRLSRDGKQLKTYAKMHTDKNHPYEFKEPSFGISKKAAKSMNKAGIRLVYDIDHQSLFLTTEEECSEGVEPGKKNFKATSIGEEYKSDTSLTIKEGNLFLKPYKIIISSKCDPYLKSKGIKIMKGVKDKGSIDKTMDKCRLIWVLCKGKEDFPLIEEKYKDQYDKMMSSNDETEKKKAESLRNCVLINKNLLEELKNVPYWSQSIEYAKAHDDKEPQAEKI